MNNELRVLVLAPTQRDGELCRTILAEAGVEALACATITEICREIAEGAGAAILTEESLSPMAMTELAGRLAAQEPWSDLPIVLLTREGANSEVALWTLETVGNVTLLERPVRVPALVSTVRAALRARKRQYQARSLLAEMVRTTEALRSADRQKDEFLAMLAHELRNPLAPVRNALSILEIVRDDPEQVEQLRAMMERQVVHLTRLVDDLLDISRIMRGRIELRHETLDLSAIIGRAIETVQPLIDAQGHRLTVSLPREKVYLKGDLVRLAQVFANLLSNAAKYTNKAGRIWLVAGLEDHEVVLSVRDNGIGISPQLLPRVFDLFVQADGSMARSQGGLGIGLTLVQRLVQMHGGSVRAESEGTGRGSEFTVRLPILLAKEPASPPRRDPGRTLIVPRRILVVDDNVDAARSLALLLQLKGHEVLYAHEAGAALDLAPEFQPEVALLDIGLPGVDGYDLARALRALPGLESMTLIAITGYGKEEDRQRAQDAGFDAHLTKPVGASDLDHLITEIKWRREAEPAASPEEAPENRVPQAPHA